MIIKKYKAPTEKEAIILAKEDLGPDAIVMNVKTIKPSGIMRIFKKKRVELTAAIDENVADKYNFADKNNDATAVSKENINAGTTASGGEYVFGRAFAGDAYDADEKEKNAIDEKINNIARLLEQQMSSDKVKYSVRDSVRDSDGKSASVTDGEVSISTDGARSRVIDLIYDKLIENEVSDKNAKAIIRELPEQSGNSPIDNVLANVYQKIVLKLVEVEPLTIGENKPKIVFFVGNTGVGKTTTMAKIASKCKLEDKLNIAMFSVDTYRIAAIEQIKTYANIINVPMEVVYTPEEMKKNVEKHSDCDFIFVDTAGRSHQNEEQRKDIQAIVDSVKDYDREIFLVVSATIKYNDLLEIARAYASMFDYKLIFTKLDETGGMGCILNLRMDIDKHLSYITCGQNVPDDISELNPQVIAKKLLGGGQ